MEFDALLLLLLFATGLVAGFVDSIAGGGGLIALPVLLSTGMPPLMALGTNKLQGSFGTLAASVYFIRKRLVNLRQMRLMILMTFVGATAGTLLVQQIDASVLALIMPGLLVLMALYFMFSKKVQDGDTDRRLGPLAFALSCTTVVGFYDGFFGPGTGSFFVIAFVALAGYSLPKATANTKILNFTSNIASLIFFAVGGQVVWMVGLLMACGQIIGGFLGARVVVNKGTGWIRPLIVVMTLGMSAKLIADQLGFSLM